MPIPPQVYNCAAEICCEPNAAHQARIEVLCALGCPHDLARIMARAMIDQGVAFAPASLMQEISRMVDHPGRRE